MTIDTQRLAADPDYWRECGAPEDATHAHAVSGRFLRLIAGNWWIWTNRRQEDPFWGCTEWPSVNPEHIIPRPKTASEEWVDGLPPVGWHGECTWGTKVDWCECVVLPRNRAAIDMSQRGQGWTIEELDDHEFRPLRTKQERQRDELVSLIVEDTRSEIQPNRLADAIIADGWTKP